MQEQIRELDRQREQLQAILDATRTPQKALTAEADAKVDKVMKPFGRLRQTLKKADTVRLRELLNEAIDTRNCVGRCDGDVTNAR